MSQDFQNDESAPQEELRTVPVRVPKGLPITVRVMGRDPEPGVVVESYSEPGLISCMVFTRNGMQNVEECRHTNDPVFSNNSESATAHESRWDWVEGLMPRVPLLMLKPPTRHGEQYTLVGDIPGMRNAEIVPILTPPIINKMVEHLAKGKNFNEIAKAISQPGVTAKVVERVLKNRMQHAESAA